MNLSLQTKKNKCVILTLILILMCGNFPVKSSAEQSDDYVEIYKEFIQHLYETEHSWGDCSISGLQLVDLNFDGTPELIIYDPGAGSGMSFSIIQIIDGQPKARYATSNMEFLGIDTTEAIPNTRYENFIFWNSELCCGKYDAFELRKDNKAGEYSWYIKSCNDGGDTYNLSLYKCEMEPKISLKSLQNKNDITYNVNSDNLWNEWLSGTEFIEGINHSLTQHIWTPEFNNNPQFHNTLNSEVALKSWLEKYKNANKKITVNLDGMNIAFDQDPIIIDGRTLVPLRAIFEELGATVDWIDATRTAIAVKGDKKISISIGSQELYINGECKTLDVPAQIINSRTLVPVRAVSEAFDCSVDWDGTTRTVIITKESTDKNYTDVTDTMSQKWKDEFSSFVMSEAATAEVAPYNILESYDCNSFENIRSLAWHFISDYSGTYLKELNTVFSDDIHTEYINETMIRTQSWLIDTVIKDYYNISIPIPQFEKIGDVGEESLFYNNYYYFANVGGRGASEYKPIIEKIYDMDNNQYCFEYKIASSLFGDDFDLVSDKTYYALMERKTLNNESFSNFEFWSIKKASTNADDIL